jgi:hypothetical protein
MLSNREVFLGILLPLLVSLVIGAVAAWKRQAWLLPLGLGVGFLVGYANSLGSSGGFGLPAVPPSDGTDWLFWTTIPAIILAATTGWLRRGWMAILAAWAGAVVWMILKPLVPGTLSSTASLELAIAAAIVAPVITGLLHLAAQRLGHGWVAAALCIVLGGTGVVVLSSNLRTTGVYGLGAGAAAAAAMLFAARLKATQALAVLSTTILFGLLACGLFYPEPGVKPVFAGILAGAPLLVLLGLAVPAKKPWLRGAVAALAVAIAVAAVAAPAALAAKHAAEDYPTSGY